MPNSAPNAGSNELMRAIKEWMRVHRPEDYAALHRTANDEGGVELKNGYLTLDTVATEMTYAALSVMRLANRVVCMSTED